MLERKGKERGEPELGRPGMKINRLEENVSFKMEEEEK